MSFLGMGTFEILIILLVAFIFLGPERMIDAAKILGKWTGELRRMGSTVQAEMDDIANVGAPLSQRPPPPTRANPNPNSNPGQEQSAATSHTPLDQDEPDALNADGPVAFRRAQADAARSPAQDETRTTPNKETP